MFTGQSGVKTAEAVDKLASFCSYKGKKVAVIKFEPYLHNEYLRSNPDNDAKVISGKGGYLLLLSKPKSLLKELWRNCFSKFIDNINKAEEENVFVVMHAVFYHQMTREFFSCLDFKCLENLCFKKVITLIDDIYDIYAKLRAPDQMYSDYLCYLKDNPPALNLSVDSIMNLLNILDWRSIEIAISEFIADAFNKPHFLLAVKHPLHVAYDILFSEKTPFYISHPITALRELWAGSEADVQEADSVSAEINTVIHSVERNNKCVLFSPTTIDELRIRKNADGEYIPFLGKRWVCDKLENLLFIQNPTLFNPLDPGGYFNSPRPEIKILTSLLSVLVDKISKQISSRDYKMVEQCCGLIVYRPYFRGRESKGVDSEVKFNCKLSNKSQRPTYIFNRPEDIASIKIRRAFGEGAVINPPSIDVVSKLLSDVDFRPALLNDSIESGLFRLSAEKYGYRPEFDLKKIGSPFSGGRGSAGAALIGSAWDEAARRANSAEAIPLKQWVSEREWIVDSITPQLFVEKCFQN